MKPASKTWLVWGLLVGYNLVHKNLIQLTREASTNKSAIVENACVNYHVDTCLQTTKFFSNSMSDLLAKFLKPNDTFIHEGESKENIF